MSTARARVLALSPSATYRTPEVARQEEGGRWCEELTNWCGEHLRKTGARQVCCVAWG